MGAASFADPPGDPDAVDEAAARLTALTRDLDEVAGRLRSCVPTQQAWLGQTADGVRLSADGAARAIAREAASMAPAGPALHDWADDLRQARRAMAQLRRRYEQEVLDHERRMRQLAEEEARAAAMAAAAVGAPASGARALAMVGPSATVLEQVRHGQAVADLHRQADQVRDHLEDRALHCRRRLEETRPGFVRGHRESVDDYVRGIAVELLDEIPVLRKHAETLDSALWALVIGPQAYLVGSQVFRRGSALFKYAKFGDPLYATRYSWLQRQLLSRLGLASWLDPASTVGRAWLGTARTSNLLSVFSNAASGRGAAGLLSGARAAAQAGGASRVLGVAGAGAATVYSAVNVASQGNPVRAWRENGAAYGADVAELGFNASMTTFMIAPNPYSAVAMGVTGIAWAGFEIYSHRDDIARLASDAIPMVKDTFDAAQDAVVSTTAGAVSGAKKLGSALNPFD